MIENEDFINEFKTNGIITTLLNKAFGKEKKMEINLHDTIEKNENSMNNILYKDPYFNDLQQIVLFEKMKKN